MDETEGVHGGFDGTIKRRDISWLGGAHLDAKFEVVGQLEMGMSLRGCALYPSFAASCNRSGLLGFGQLLAQSRPNLADTRCRSD